MRQWLLTYNNPQYKEIKSLFKLKPSTGKGGIFDFYVATQDTDINASSIICWDHWKTTMLSIMICFMSKMETQKRFNSRQLTKNEPNLGRLSKCQGQSGNYYGWESYNPTKEFKREWLKGHSCALKAKISLIRLITSWSTRYDKIGEGLGKGIFYIVLSSLFSFRN